MIYISGMEGGSGCGEAASRKAGWLRGGVPGAAVLRGAAQSAAAQLLDALNTALANRSRGYTTPAPAPPPGRSATSASSGSPASRQRRPEFAPDGRPLPPDGSAPPARATPAADAGRQAALPVDAKAGAAAAQLRSQPAPAEFDATGRPLPPDGSTPPARTPAAEAGRRSPRRQPPHAMAPTRATRAPGTPLPPGTVPSAPSGHAFVSRPVAAPPGEFLFDVRCSCGAVGRAPVRLDDLRRAAQRGLPPAAAIAIATQDALDAMHAGG